MTKRIMDGMLVLELANVLAGPAVGQFLGELGATVVKIESTQTNGDVTRTWRLKDDAPDSDITAYFSAINCGKQSIALNFKIPKHLEVVHNLAKRADCVIASFKPGDAEKLKVDANTLLKLNERLVYAQVTGYGLDDPRAGYDAVIQAESGFQYMNGEPDGPPCKMPVALIDILASHQLREAILIQLWRREKTGKGGSVDVSLFASAVSSLANQASGYLMHGAIPKRLGSDHPNIVPYGSIFDTATPGQQITLGVGSDSQFVSLCKIIGAPHLSDRDGTFHSNPLRCQNRNELLPILKERIAKFEAKELLEKLCQHKVPAGAINRLDQTFQQPEAQRLIAKDANNNTIGLRQIAFKGIPEGSDNNLTFTPPPHYGQDTRKVLREILNMDDAEIDALLHSKI